MIHVAQFATRDSDIDYNPMRDNPVAFLRRWIKWRSSVVSAAAEHRAQSLLAEVRRMALLARACDVLDELFKILRQSRDDEDLKRRTMALLRCTKEEAAVVMAIPWPRLARFEKAQLLSKADERKRQAKIERGVAAQPVPKLRADAESAAEALQKTLQTAFEMRTGKTERRRKT
jgi:DNA gyrase/topoisomerase IV subunit A